MARSDDHICGDPGDPRWVYVRKLLVEVERLTALRTSIRVSGDISIKNVAPEKTVSLVYTLDAWRTTKFESAKWYRSDVNSDREAWRFSFQLPGEDSFYENPAEANLEMVVRYSPVGHADVYDNNNNENFCLNIKRPTVVHDRWQHIRVVSYAWEVTKNVALGAVAVPKGMADGRVLVRYTRNNWRDIDDCEPEMALEGEDTAYLTFKIGLDEHGSFEFVASIKEIGAEDFWDNNFNRNFGFSSGRVLVQKTESTNGA